MLLTNYKLVLCLFNAFEFSDSPSDDGRGNSPPRMGSNLGRRGSYKTSRGTFVFSV